MRIVLRLGLTTKVSAQTSIGCSGSECNIALLARTQDCTSSIGSEHNQQSCTGHFMHALAAAATAVVAAV